MENSAHGLRQANKESAKKRIKHDAQVLIQNYLDEYPMAMPGDLQNHYESMNKLLESKFDTAQSFQLARRGLLEFVRDYNKLHQLNLDEPVVPILATRDRLTIGYDWFTHGRVVADSSTVMIDIWQRKKRFSANDLVEGLIYSSIMFGGINDIQVLTALYDWLFGDRVIYKIDLPIADTDQTTNSKSIAVIPLSVFDNNYGCAIDDSEGLIQFVDYVPDDLSLCFLLALKGSDLGKANIKPLNTLINDLSKKLKLTNKDINRPKESMLIKWSNYHWRQLEGNRIDGALAMVKQGDIKTTGLPTKKLIIYNKEPINLNPMPLLWSELFDASYQSSKKLSPQKNTIAYPAFSKNIIKEVQEALKLSRNEAIAQLEIIQKDNSQPNAQRLLSWALALLDDTKIRLNTISKYMGCIGRDWLMLTIDEDLDQWEGSDFEEIYEQIIQSKVEDNRKKSILTKSSEWDEKSDDLGDEDDSDQISQNQSKPQDSAFDRLKDTQKFTYGRLKAFHDHQQTRFDAPYVYFPWGNNRQVVKADMISHRVYRAMKTYIQSSSLKTDQKQLCLVILALAYRTGMRINEIIGIRLNDVADIGRVNGHLIERPKIILSPNRYRRLKSHSAKRVIPIDSLLKADEMQQFMAHYHQQHRLKRRYLFSLGSGDQPLAPTFFSNLMKIIWDRLLVTHDFTFHSFRHTAISQLALVLSHSPLAQVMTDYDTDHSANIVSAVLANNKDQGVWFGLASLAGHLTPDTTFEHYIHTAHLLAGWQMSTAQLTLPLIVLDMLTGIDDQTANRQESRAYDANTKQIHLDKIKNYLVGKVAGKESLFVDNRSPANTDHEHNAVDVQPSIFIHSKVYDAITMLEELQNSSVDRRSERLVEVAIRHGIAINEARQLYDNACRLCLDNDRLLLTKPTGRENQEVLVKAIDRVYQMSIDDPEELKTFASIFSERHNMTSSFISFGKRRKHLEMLQQFMSIGCQIVDPIHWEIRSHSEQSVRQVKKDLGLNSLIRVGTHNSSHAYDVKIIQKKNRKSDKNWAKDEKYLSSSGLLKYLGYLLLILI